MKANDFVRRTLGRNFEKLPSLRSKTLGPTSSHYAGYFKLILHLLKCVAYINTLDCNIHPQMSYTRTFILGSRYTSVANLKLLPHPLSN